MAVLAAIEAAWWALCWRSGVAPLPYIGTYLALACAGLAAALALRTLFSGRNGLPSLSVLLLGTILIAVGASLLLPLKYAIPSEIPIWVDRPIAAAERHLFGADPWAIADHFFGWALVPVDRVYGLWLPIQTLVLFMVMTEPASHEKSRALIAYGLAWFVLGVVAATLFSSAGPIFYDRLFGSQHFAGLADRLRQGGAWMVRAESDAMWESLATGRPGLVAGVSAMPSLHVAISFWMYLAARSLAPRMAVIAFVYAMFMWVGSVQLGWHYAGDGVAGIAGMAVLWWLSGILDRKLGGAKRTG